MVSWMRLSVKLYVHCLVIFRIKQTYHEHGNNVIFRNVDVCFLIDVPELNIQISGVKQLSAISRWAKASARVSGNMGCKSTCCQKLTSCLGSALAWHNAHPCLYTWLDSSAFESTITVSIEREREAAASLKPTRSEFKYVIIEACTSESLTSNTYWL